MTLYNVHIFREMRLYYPSIEASTPKKAARIAADRPTADAEYVEDCEGENIAALIDVAGDDDFAQSTIVELRESPQRTNEPVDIHRLLDERRQVAVIWSIEDVQSVRSDLTDEQAWEVLKRCERVHDCEIGFNWFLIGYVADDLFPAAEGGRP